MNDVRDNIGKTLIALVVVIIITVITLVLTLKVRETRWRLRYTGHPEVTARLVLSTQSLFPRVPQRSQR